MYHDIQEMNITSKLAATTKALHTTFHEAEQLGKTFTDCPSQYSQQRQAHESPPLPPLPTAGDSFDMTAVQLRHSVAAATQAVSEACDEFHQYRSTLSASMKRRTEDENETSENTTTEQPASPQQQAATASKEADVAAVHAMDATDGDCSTTTERSHRVAGTRQQCFVPLASPCSHTCPLPCPQRHLPS